MDHLTRQVKVLNFLLYFTISSVGQMRWFFEIFSALWDSKIPQNSNPLNIEVTSLSHFYGILRKPEKDVTVCRKWETCEFYCIVVLHDIVVHLGHTWMRLFVDKLLHKKKKKWKKKLIDINIEKCIKISRGGGIKAFTI